MKEDARREESRVLPCGDVGVEPRAAAAVAECCAGRGEKVSVLFRTDLLGCASWCWVSALGRWEAAEEAAEAERVRWTAGGMRGCGTVRPKAERGGAGAAEELPGREVEEKAERRDSVDRAEAVLRVLRAGDGGPLLSAPLTARILSLGRDCACDCNAPLRSDDCSP